MLECRAVTLPVYEKARVGRKVNFAPGKIPLRDKSSGKYTYSVPVQETRKKEELEMCANAQCDGRPAEYRWRPLFNAAKFNLRPLLECRAVTLP